MGLVLRIGACSKSDENSSNYKKLIIGVWRNIEQIDYCGTFQDVYLWGPCDSQTTYEFTESHVIVNYYEKVGSECEYSYTTHPYRTTGYGFLANHFPIHFEVSPTNNY